MRTQIIVATAILSLVAATRAVAAPIYTTTDLGAGYQLQAGAGGQVYGVTGAGGAVYAFDKSPVTSIDVQTVLPDGTFHFLTLQNGTHQVGYNDGYSYPAGLILYPTFMSINSGWFLTPYRNISSPVSDINGQGQVVGTSQYLLGQSSTYAAFSDPNGRTHSFDDSAMNDLNNYIATIPGVSLTSAVKIDDLGRIIAIGSNGDDYLLTPTAIGPASPVPEPSAAMLLGLVGTLLGLRSIRQRWWS